MSLKIALILSVVLQFSTAIIALTLIKLTRTNIAWWMISIGFLLMAFRRLFELFQELDAENNLINTLTNSWIGVFISIVMLVSLIFIKRLFNIQKRLDSIKRENETRVFSAIIRTEEEQKYHFSKELHDGLGPLLSAVKMALSSLLTNNYAEKEKKIIENADNLIDESIRTVKEISTNLSPHILLNFGLIKALKSYINKLQNDNSPNTILNSNISDQRFSKNIEAVCYRIICELITNTIRHAQAQNIFLDIILDVNTLNIKYMDDGIGFQYSENDEVKLGLGLTNMKSRIKSVNGSCQIYSKENAGFNANIVINI